MIRNLLGRRSLSEEEVAELKAAQKYSPKNVSPNDLPFDLVAELGSVQHAEIISPGVYFLIVEKDSERTEVYVVTEDAPAISEEARNYGQDISDCPGLRVYPLHEKGSGKHIIDFEVCRYQVKCHLPVEGITDSLLSRALYGMEEYPDYFGTFPVPFHKIGRAHV